MDLDLNLNKLKATNSIKIDSSDLHQMQQQQQQQQQLHQQQQHFYNEKKLIVNDYDDDDDYSKNSEDNLDSQSNGDEYGRAAAAAAEATRLIQDHNLLAKQNEISIKMNSLASRSATSCPFVKLASLNIDSSNQEWSVKVLITNLTKVLPFQKSQLDASSKKLRAQLYDGLTYIELVAFNDDTQRVSHELALNQIYVIQNGNLRLTKKLFRAWPNQANSSAYDLQVRADTRIIPYEQFKLLGAGILDENHLQTSAVTVVTTSLTTLTTTPSKLIPITNQTSNGAVAAVEASRQASHVDQPQLATATEVPLLLYTPIVQLTEASLVNTCVNVLGVLHEIRDLKQTIDSRRRPLSVLNVYLIDCSQYYVCVTFWGRDANMFRHKIGECLELRNAKLTAFNGRSLSVQRDTKCTNMSTQLQAKRTCNSKSSGSRTSASVNAASNLLLQNQVNDLLEWYGRLHVNSSTTEVNQLKPVNIITKLK